MCLYVTLVCACVCMFLCIFIKFIAGMCMHVSTIYVCVVYINVSIFLYCGLIHTKHAL
jgi:hypothetical protein